MIQSFLDATRMLFLQMSKIKSTKIDVLNEAMRKEQEMEEDMLKSNVDPKIILG